MADPAHVAVDVSMYTGRNGQILYFKAHKQAAEVVAALRDAGYTGLLRDPAEPEVLLCGRDPLSEHKVYQFWPATPAGRGKPGGAASSRRGAGRQLQAADGANGSADNLEIIDSVLTSSGAMEDTAAPVTSVFVKDLPPEATKEKLHEAFSQFGELKDEVNGVQLRTFPSRDPIAFVTFLQAEAVSSAVAGPVYIDGQQVTVAERRPYAGRFGRGPGRGRRNHGRKNHGRLRQTPGDGADGNVQATGEPFGVEM